MLFNDIGWLDKSQNVMNMGQRIKFSRVWGLRGIWVSGGETEGLHFVDVLSFGDEFREDGALGGIQEKFGEALA